MQKNDSISIPVLLKIGNGPWTAWGNVWLRKV